MRITNQFRMSTLGVFRRHAAPRSVDATASPSAENEKDTTFQFEGEIEAVVDRLKKIATRPLAQLTREQCADLDSIRKLALKMYDTPSYEVFYKEVLKYFQPDSEILPHTVGSFFVGCVVANNLTSASADVNSGCSLLCADSLPPPSSSSVNKPWGFCSQNVIWCVLGTSAIAKNIRRLVNATDSKTERAQRQQPPPLEDIIEAFDFVFLTHLPSTSKAVLFLDYPDYDKFPGFTKAEKANLMYIKYITDVKLLSYDHDGTNYIDLLQGKVIQVKDIKEREVSPEQAILRSRQQSQLRGQEDLKKRKLARPSTATSDSPLDWSQAVILAIALALLCYLIFATSFIIREIRRSTNPKSAASSRRR